MTAAAAGPTQTNPIALLFPELEMELAVTRKMLAAVPLEQAEWKPHAKSSALLALTNHLVSLLDFTKAIAAMDVLPYDPAAFKSAPITGTADLLDRFDTKAESLRAVLAQLDWARLNGQWKMTMGERVFVEGQRALMLRQMGINHIVHHRAQLGVYLRLLDVKVPGSYGPSADS
jgi:uncharacterized damage-inducible protein DinB